MNVLIAYATTEGHTEKIARFIEVVLSGEGISAELNNVGELSGGQSVSSFDKVIVAGSVHSAKHQADIENYVFAHRDQLNEIPVLFLSVSLAAAFEDNLQDAEEYVDTFKQATNWEPTRHLLAAGAIKPGEYGWFEESKLMEGDLASHLTEDLQEEREFTDWDALAQAVVSFVKG